MTHSLNINEELSFAASFGNPNADAIADGFNQYGVRENVDEDGNLRSVDVNYEAMEPGDPEDRNGVRITEEFLREVGSKDYSGSQPFMMDHERKTLSKAGDVRDVWFSEEAGKLMVQSRIPNTGSRTHDELIKRFTYDPPTVTNGSIGFGDSYEAVRNDDGEPELVDGTLQEFSTTPFPAGYDEGGLRAAFAEKAVEAAKESPIGYFGDFESIEKEVLSMNFSEDEDELDEVYSDWSDAVNMTASQLESWSNHDCADTASQDPSKVRKRNMGLLEKNKSDWTQSDIDDAKRTISFIERMRGQKPDSPAEGGKGTCPSEWAVSLLNWAYNPFDSMPSGTPNPEENSSSSRVLSFEVGSVDQVYAKYQETVNMSDEELSEWDMHPCADVGDNNHEDVRTKSQMLLGSPKEAWDAEFVGYATEIIEFIERRQDDGPERPENGEQGTCPTRWAIQLLNRGYNPFDEMPEMGRPYQGDFAEVNTFEIDDKPQDRSSSEDGFENLEVAVFTEQLSI